MNNLLVFFAFPVATIILSITAQKLIKSPILVASVFFAIYLIVAFAAFDAFFLIYAFIYSIFAYITAIMTQMVADCLKSKVSTTNVSNHANGALNNTVSSNCSVNRCNPYSNNTGTATNIRVRVEPNNMCTNSSRRYR